MIVWIPVSHCGILYDCLDIQTHTHIHSYTRYISWSLYFLTMINNSAVCVIFIVFFFISLTHKTYSVQELKKKSGWNNTKFWWNKSFLFCFSKSYWVLPLFFIVMRILSLTQFVTHSFTHSFSSYFRHKCCLEKIFLKIKSVHFLLVWQLLSFIFFIFFVLLKVNIFISNIFSL